MWLSACCELFQLCKCCTYSYCCTSSLLLDVLLNLIDCLALPPHLLLFFNRLFNWKVLQEQTTLTSVWKCCMQFGWRVTTKRYLAFICDHVSLNFYLIYISSFRNLALKTRNKILIIPSHSHQRRRRLQNPSVMRKPVAQHIQEEENLI